MSRRRRALVPIAVSLALGAVVATALSGVAGASRSAGDTAVIRFGQDWTNFDVQTGGTSSDFQSAAPRLRPARCARTWAQARAVPRDLVDFDTFEPTEDRDLHDPEGCQVLRRDGSDPPRCAQLVQADAARPKTRNVIPNYFGPGPFQLSANVKTGTFTFKSLTPFKNLLAGFALGLGSVICPNGLVAAQSDPRALQTGMYGSGPYTLVSATHGDQVVYKLRHDWTWGPPGSDWRKMPENLVYKIITDDTTAANSLLTDAADIGTVSGADVGRLKADKSITTQAAYNYHVFPLVFNFFPGHVTTDEKVRQALMMSVSQKDWNQAAFNGDGSPSPSILHPKGECYTPKVNKMRRSTTSPPRGRCSSPTGTRSRTV